MYAYFIDDWVYDNAHRKQFDRMDLLLTQRGIVGRKVRLGRLTDAKKSIEDVLHAGVRTIVAVGNDATLSKVLNIFKAVVHQPDFSHYTHTASLGMIVITEPSIVGGALRVMRMEDAVTALVSRHVKSMDVGLLNKRHYFFGVAHFPLHSSFMFPTYTMSSVQKKHIIAVGNSVAPLGEMGIYADPSDGKLNAVIAHEKKQSNWGGGAKKSPYECDTHFLVSSITIGHPDKTIMVIADVEKSLSTPVLVEVEPRAVLFVNNITDGVSHG